MQHILETQQFDREALQKLFDVATSLEGKRDESLRGKIMASLFYEPSTRTRLSFESAMLRLGGNVLSMENASESSSSTKGETLEDTIRIVDNYADVIVLRHPEAGAAERASKVSDVSIINAGDGGQHPTQAFLDLYTIEREIGRTDDFHIAFVGNLAYYRSARSLAYLLAKYKNVRMTFVSAPELKMKDDIKNYITENGVQFEETDDMKSAMGVADVVYQTRVAKEWIPDSAVYEKLKNQYVITRAMADHMKEGAILIHPLPRAGEIEDAVDDSPHAVYFKQAGYGLLVRMALLKMLLG